ncbi:MAG: ABC transporter substrate-binding protein [Puniceicoccales bacterium]|jgi:microcin C transport system substrate-binding protein|nr:ABC transporter substrate-binding protein [Puniceicoccales bacterium]
MRKKKDKTGITESASPKREGMPTSRHYLTVSRSRFWHKVAFISYFLFLISYFPLSASSMRPEDIYQSPEAAAYYKAHPDFFHFATPADLPKDLIWETNDTDTEFSDPQAKLGGVFNFAFPVFPPTLRRVGPNSNNSFRGYAYDAYDLALTFPNPETGKTIPGTALSWAVSKDRRTVYYKLDPNVCFTDGQPVTADDYFFAFYFFQSPHIVAPFYNDYYSREFAGITKFDDYTIAITLPDERPDPLYFAMMYPIPRQFFKEFGPDYPSRYQYRYQPTTGPYQVLDGDVRMEQSITFTRVKNWWGDSRRYYRNRYNPDKLVFRIVRDNDKIFQMFVLGEIDALDIRTPKFWYRLNNEPVFQKGYVEKATFYYEKPRPTYGIYINTWKPFLGDLNVRLGLQYAMDFQRVIDTFFRGDYQRLNQMFEGYGEFTNPNVKARPYDPDRAMAYFAKAGFAKRGPDGILVNKDGTRLSFELTMDDSEMRKFLPTLVDSARKAGLELRPEVLQRTTQFKKILEKKHDLCFSAWATVGKYPDFWQTHHIDNAIETDADGTVKAKRQTNNITSTRDKELSELIDRHRIAKTEQEVKDLGWEIQQRIHDEASFIPAFKVATYRLAYWRWLNFPKNFGMKASDEFIETSVFWIDEQKRAETQNALRTGKTFPPQNRVYDQHNSEN